MKRILKVFLYIVFTLLLIATAGWFVLRQYMKDLLVERLQKELKTTFGEYYHLDFSSFKTDITSLTFSIRFYQPQFTTDTTQLEELQKYPPVYFKADSFEVNGINIRKLFLGSTLDLKDIQLHNPDLIVLIKKQAQGEGKSTNQKTRKQKLITDILLSKLALLKGNIHLIQFYDLTDTIYSGSDINLEVTGMHIPTQAPGGIYQGSDFDNLKFAMKNVCFSPEKLHYEYRMESIRIDLKGDAFECMNLTLLPEKSLRRLSQDEAYQKTFAQIRLGRLSFSGFDYQKLVDQELHIRSITIDNAQISLFRNKEKKLNKNLIKETLQSSLRRTPLALKIDSVLINNMNLVMQILFPKHETPALIPLSRINGTLTNINTLPGSKESIRLSLNGHIMKTGTLSFNATFPVHLETHQYRAQVNAMPFSEWNEVINKVGNIRIEDGSITKIRLSGNCSNDENRGKIVFEYQNLKCAVLRQNNSGELKRSKLLSFGGNLLIRNNNPDKNEMVPVERTVYFKRQQYQGQTVLWIGGLLDGMLATIFSEDVKLKIDKLKEKKRK